jgi:hypothetical protein
LEAWHDAVKDLAMAQRCGMDVKHKAKKILDQRSPLKMLGTIYMYIEFAFKQLHLNMASNYAV